VTESRWIPDDAPVIKLLDGANLDGPLEDRVYSSPRGPVRRLKFPVTIEGNPLFWEHPAEEPGASNPVWVTMQRVSTSTSGPCAVESTADDESRAVQELIDRLVGQFPGVPPESVRDIVNASWQEFTGRPIRAFVPVLAERSARQQLRSQAPAD
jgi:hypothetical protein